MKRSRKASQLAQFSVYEDETSRADSSDSDTSFELSPVGIESQLQKIQPHISVNISFQAEFHSKSKFSPPQNHSQNTTKILQSLAVNSRQRIPKIPQKWTENQPNNHTSMLNFQFLLFFIIISLYIYIYFNILIAPSILDDFTADKKLNSFLIPSEETAENFQNRLISEILRSLSNFEPISMKSHIDQS